MLKQGKCGTSQVSSLPLLNVVSCLELIILHVRQCPPLLVSLDSYIFYADLRYYGKTRYNANVNVRRTIKAIKEYN